MQNVFISNIGLNAHAVALATRTPVKITGFAVGTAAGYTTTDPTDLQGTVVYRGPINNIEMLSEHSVKVTVTIPSGVPNFGTVQLGEIGLYLESGELFAVAVLDEAVPKTREWDFSVDIVITYSRLATSLTLNVSSNASLPSSLVRMLPAPSVALGNAWAVLDSTRNDVEEQNSSSPAIAIRFGTGGSGFQWALTGFQRVYRGLLPAVASDKASFQIEPNASGFWCNDKEELVVMTPQECRRVIYSKDNHTFSVVDTDPFSVLTTQTEVRIWRLNSNEHALPSRKGVPTHYVLHPGLDSWDAARGGRTSSDLRMKALHFTADGQQRVFPLSITGRIVGGLAYINGRLADPDDYTMEQVLVFMNPPAAGVNITAYVWFTLPSAGSELLLAENTWMTHGDADEFTLSAVPSGYDQILVFDSTRLVAPANYQVTGRSLKLNYKPRGRLTAVTLINRNKNLTSTRLLKYNWRGDGTTRIYSTGRNLVRGQTLLFIGGYYQIKETYAINGHDVELDDAPADASNIERAEIGRASCRERV